MNKKLSLVVEIQHDILVFIKLFLYLPNRQTGMQIGLYNISYTKIRCCRAVLYTETKHCGELRRTEAYFIVGCYKIRLKAFVLR